jgi:hypothetical protein
MNARFAADFGRSRHRYRITEVDPFQPFADAMEAPRLSAIGSTARDPIEIERKIAATLDCVPDPTPGKSWAAAFM